MKRFFAYLLMDVAVLSSLVQIFTCAFLLIVSNLDGLEPWIQTAMVVNVCAEPVVSILALAVLGSFLRSSKGNVKEIVGSMHVTPYDGDDSDRQ